MATRNGFHRFQKPFLGAQLDVSHPLAQGIFDCLLFNEGGGTRATNLASPGTPATGTSSPTWKATERGIGVNCTGGSSFDIANHGNLAAGDLSVRILHKPTTWPNAYTALFDKGSSSSTRECSIFVATTGTYNACSIGQFYNESDLGPTTGVMATGVVSDFVLVRSGSIVTLYLNGKSLGTITGNTGVAAEGTAISLGRNTSTGGANYDGTYITVQTWKGRALSAADVAWLYEEPYAMIQAPGVRRFTSLPGGAIIFLSPAPATGTATGTLSAAAQRRATGTVTGQAVTTTTVSARRAASISVTGAMAASLTLRALRGLSAAITGQGSASATGAALRRVGGNVTGTATGSASPRAYRAATGSSAGQGSAAVSLRLARTLQLSATGQASAGAGLRRYRGAAGTATGQSGAGVAVRKLARFSAGAPGQSSSSLALSVYRDLVASARGTSNASIIFILHLVAAGILTISDAPLAVLGVTDTPGATLTISDTRGAILTVQDSL